MFEASRFFLKPTRGGGGGGDGGGGDDDGGGDGEGGGADDHGVETTTHTVSSQPWQPENVGRPSQPAGVGQSTRAGGGTAKNRTEAAGIRDHDLGPLSTRWVQRFRS